MDKLQRTTIRMPSKLHKRTKSYGVENNQSFQQVTISALEQFLPPVPVAPTKKGKVK